MPTEIVEIAFPFLAEVVRAKRRTPKPETFRATIPVLVTTATAEEAPVCCVASPAKGARGTTTEIRHNEGHFYRPVADDRFGMMTIGRLRDLAKADPKDDTGWGSNPFIDIACPDGIPTGFRRTHDWLNALPAFDDIPMRSVVMDDRPHAETRLRKAFQDYLLVGENLFERCLEPKLCIAEHYGDAQIAFVTAPVEDDEYLSVFRVDRLAEARLYAKSLHDAGVLHGKGVRLGFQIKVERPEFLTRDDPVQAVKGVAEGILGEAGEAVRHFRRPGIMAYADLKEAGERLLAPDAGIEEAKEFIAAYARVVAAAETFDAERGKESLPDGVEGLLRDRATYQLRWDGFESATRQIPAEDDESLAALSP